GRGAGQRPGEPQALVGPEEVPAARERSAIGDQRGAAQPVGEAAVEVVRVARRQAQVRRDSSVLKALAARGDGRTIPASAARAAPGGSAGRDPVTEGHDLASVDHNDGKETRAGTIPAE